MVDRRTLGRAALALVGAYGALVGLTAGLQRRLIYPAPRPPRPPDPRFGELVETTSAGGRRVYALWAPPVDPAAPVALVCHGNGEQLADVGLLAERLRRHGLGVLAVEYPGYGLASDQSPDEAGLFDAAAAALALLAGRLAVPAGRTVLLGHSLGTGVVVEMARRGHGARVGLLSPYTSLAAVAQRLAPFLPAERLILDRYDSASRAPSVRAPVRLVHGELDELIPVGMSRTLAGLFPQATLEVVAGAHHNDLFAPPHGAGVLARMSAFLRGEPV